MSPAPVPAGAHIGEILGRIVTDLKTIAKDEVDLARLEIEKTAKTAAADAAVVIMSGVLALIGFGFACVAAVDALGGVIPQLWARLLIMAAVYLVAGGVIAGIFAKRLSRDAVPDLATPKQEAKETVADIKQGLTH